MLYLITIYLLDNKFLYDKLVEYLPSFLIKGLNYYKHIRFIYLVIDFIFVFLSLGGEALSSIDHSATPPS